MSGVVAAARGSAAATARAWLDAVNAGDVAALAALLAPDFDWLDGSDSTGPMQAHRAGGGRDAAAALRTWREWFAASPDLRLELERELDGEEWAVLQVRVHATRRGVATGAFSSRPGLPAAIARLELPGCAILVLRGDRITRLWTYWDAHALYRGASAAPAHVDF